MASTASRSSICRLPAICLTRLRHRVACATHRLLYPELPRNPETAMNIQNDPNAWAVKKFGDRPAGAAHRGPDPGARRGRYTDDLNLPGPGLCGDRARRATPTACSRASTTDRRARPCRACSQSIPAPTLPRLWHAQMHAAAEEPRRHADEEAAAAGARDRQGALRRRSGRLRGRRDRIAARGGGRSGRARHRAAARGDAARARRSSRARRSCSTTCPAMSRSTIITATPRR